MNVIANILTAIEERTGIKPVPFSSKTIQNLPSITYVCFRQGDDAVKESWRFQTRVTAEGLEEALAIEEEIADELCSLGDNPKHGALSIAINGGGTLEDERTGLPQLLTYFDILNKS